MIYRYRYLDQEDPADAKRKELYLYLKDHYPVEMGEYDHTRFAKKQRLNNWYPSLDELIPQITKIEIQEFDFKNYILHKYHHFSEKDDLELLVARNIQSAKDYLLIINEILSHIEVKEKCDERNISSAKYNPRNNSERLLALMERPGVIDFYKALEILPFGEEILRVHHYILEEDRYYLFSYEYFRHLAMFMILNYQILLKEVIGIYNWDIDEKEEGYFLDRLKRHVEKLDKKGNLEINIYKKFKRAIRNGLFTLVKNEDESFYYNFNHSKGAARWFFYDGNFRKWGTCIEYIRVGHEVLTKNFRNNSKDMIPKDYIPIRKEYFPELFTSMEQDIRNTTKNN